MKVLIAEEEEYLREGWASELEASLEVVKASTIRETEEKFAANPDVAAVVVDACMDWKHYPNTQPLVQKIRESFTGPIVATSNQFHYQRVMLDAGCDFATDKYSLVAKLREVLGVG